VGGADYCAWRSSDLLAGYLPTVFRTMSQDKNVVQIRMKVKVTGVKYDGLTGIVERVSPQKTKLDVTNGFIYKSQLQQVQVPTKTSADSKGHSSDGGCPTVAVVGFRRGFFALDLLGLQLVFPEATNGTTATVVTEPNAGSATMTEISSRSASGGTIRGRASFYFWNEHDNDASATQWLDKCTELARLDKVAVEQTTLGFADTPAARAMAIAARCSIDLLYLDLSGYDALRGNDLAQVISRCPQLQHLNLRGCTDVGDEGVTAVGAGCPQLQHLDLAGCVGVGDEGVKAVGAGCRQLQHLYLAYCTDVGDEGVKAVGAGCPQLQNLDLRGCKSVGDEGVMSGR
jgi:hypothetical protein